VVVLQGYFGSVQLGLLASNFSCAARWKQGLSDITVRLVMEMMPLMETPLKSDYVRYDKRGWHMHQASLVRFTKPSTLPFLFLFS